MINFKLKDVEGILEREQNLSWFWLTDGELWLKFGNQIIYEYTNEASEYFENTSKYNEYYIVRFLEDFTECFKALCISIPDNFYELTNNTSQFREKVEQWLNESDEDSWSDKYELISWVYNRFFDSGHLIGGPNLAFFRNGDKIKIVWETEYVLENGIKLWTAKDGSFEMKYTEFVAEIKKFGDRFFKAMDKQIEYSILKNIENKERLVEEHKERKIEFYKNASFLEQDIEDDVDWKSIELLYKQMIADQNKILKKQ